ncbi:MAG: PepSY domain-containing protein [Pseudomonadota bacterium]
MNTNLIKIGALSGLIAVGGVATMVSAQTVADQTNLTEDQVIEIALLEVPGEVTEVDLKERRGNAFYEVEVTAEDGSEMELRIAAETGDVLKVKADGEDCDEDDDDGEDA